MDFFHSIFKDIAMKTMIFDLDLTLVDTTVLEPYRHNRDWQGAYSNINRCTLYPGIPELFDYIRRNNVPVCIVSTSPRPYVERIVRFFNIPVNAIVAYHDAKPIKPAPQPMFKALELLNCPACDAVSFGDRAIDIQASKSAGVMAIACTWGTKELSSLLAARPDAVISSVSETTSYLR